MKTVKKPALRQYAKSLRSNQTDAENRIWYHLRAKRLNGHKFRCQHPIGCYIVDFVCLRLKLIIELDGSQHMEQEEYDETRTAFLKQQGYKVLRFYNTDVLSNTDGVLSVILSEIEVST